MFYVIQGNAQGNLTVNSGKKKTFDEAVEQAKKALLSGNQLSVQIVKVVGTVERELAVKVTRSE